MKVVFDTPHNPCLKCLFGKSCYEDPSITKMLKSKTYDVSKVILNADNIQMYELVGWGSMMFRSICFKEVY